MEPIFKDLRVIELAGVLAGPGAGYFFAELGAKVIKIENPKTGGDVTRSWKLQSEDPGRPDSAYFWSVNAFKEVMSIDLEKESGQRSLHDLVRNADIVIANYRPGDDKKLKADAATLCALNPRLIYASVSGFGAGSTRTAYDLILQAESGFMSMNGEKNGRPLKMPVALIDLLAGHQLKEAILIALLNRYRTGNGCNISVSLFDSAIASLANQATNWLIARHLPEPSGSEHPNIAPYGEIFETKDNQLVTLAIGNDVQFSNLCKLIGFPLLATDPNYATNQLRVTNRSQLYTILYDHIRNIPYEVLNSECLDSRVPMGKIRNLSEVFELPEARAMVRSFTTNGEPVEIVSGIAFKINSLS